MLRATVVAFCVQMCVVALVFRAAVLVLVLHTAVILSSAEGAAKDRAAKRSLL